MTLDFDYHADVFTTQFIEDFLNGLAGFSVNSTSQFTCDVDMDGTTYTQNCFKVNVTVDDSEWSSLLSLHETENGVRYWVDCELGKLL